MTDANDLIDFSDPGKAHLLAGCLRGMRSHMPKTTHPFLHERSWTTWTTNWAAAVDHILTNGFTPDHPTTQEPPMDDQADAEHPWESPAGEVVYLALRNNTDHSVGYCQGITGAILTDLHMAGFSIEVNRDRTQEDGPQPEPPTEAELRRTREFVATVNPGLLHDSTAFQRAVNLMLGFDS